MERMIEKAPSVQRDTQITPTENKCASRPLSLLMDTAGATPQKKQITLGQLINKLNSLHFKNETILAVFRHINYPKNIILSLQPQPCRDEILTCRRCETYDSKQLTKLYTFQYLYVPKEQQFLEVLADIKEIHSDYMIFVLPEQCNEKSSRKRLRQTCSDINVIMLQNGARYLGKLIDCSPPQFRIGVTSKPPQTFHWVQPAEPVTLIFFNKRQTVYSGQCRILRHDGNLKIRQYTVEPVDLKIRRFVTRKLRGARHTLSLTPDVFFQHPLFGKAVSLKVYDISGSGLSVEEELSRATLFPGLIIPDLQLIFSDGKTFRCLSQVIYCNIIQSSQTPKVRCGLAILKMKIQDHVHLLGLVQQVVDERTYVNSKVDMDQLWNFFFETGFIYPEKYSLIHANKEKVKATYEKLYNSTTSVSAHFIYQCNNQILAHAAALHLYEYSWLVHHHAAIRRSDNRGGLIIANQAVSFLTEANRNSAMQMDYILCYFRPENRFPAHIFGGSARNINDPAICSIDTYAYFYHQTRNCMAPQLSQDWQLVHVDDEDLDELHTFYAEQSGGLMLQGLHLTPDRLDCSRLAETYRRIGLKRDRHIYALRHNGVLCAIVMVNISDIGLNLSDLTNSITVIVVKDQSLTASVFDALIQKLSLYYEHFEIPILLYPRRIASELGIPCKKEYTLWVYNMHFTDPCVRYMRRLLRFSQPKNRNLYKPLSA